MRGKKWIAAFILAALVFCSAAFAEKALPYRISLGAWTPIYTEAGYEYGVLTDLVGKDGVYTIIQELTDDEGCVWGRLKSGIGWINLTQLRENASPALMAYFAENLKLGDEKHQVYSMDSTEYETRIAFRANEDLTNVKLSLLALGWESLVLDEPMCMIYMLEEDTFLLADVVFYGDMTAYGVSFIDDEGRERRYSISISGKDGSLIMVEHPEGNW